MIVSSVVSLETCKTHTRGVGGNLRRLAVLSTRKELLILLDVKVIRTREIAAAGKLERKLGVVERAENVRDDRVLIHADAEHLALFVDTNDTIRRLVLSSDENGLAGDTVHVDACARLKVVEVNEAELGDQVRNAMLFGHLHSDGEVVGGLRREVDVHRLLRKRRVGCLMVNFYYVQLNMQV